MATAIPKTAKRQVFYRALEKIDGVTVEQDTARKDGKSVRIPLGRSDIDRTNMKRIMNGLGIECLDFT